MSNDANGYWSLANYVGQGFNVYGAYDMTSTTGLLFDFPDDTGHDFSFQGKTFRIPITVLGAESVNTYFQHVSGSTRESYQDSLATSANVQVGIGAFSGDLKASFSSEFQTASEFAFDRYTSYSKLGTLELRVDPSNITTSLAGAIDKLPATSNPGNLQVFADFFQRFGVYFIWRVVFGGSLQLYTAVNKASGLSTQDISVEAEASYGALFKAGMKVATSSRRETFNKNAFTSVNAIGGDLKLAAQLGLVDPNAPSADSVKLFVDWVGTVAASPAPVDFSLKGIWELCGDKRQAVETAWALYAQLMHPKLTIQTYGLPAPTQLPIITLGRQLKPAPAASPSPFGGWQIAILDRSNVLGDDGVKFSRHYPLPGGTDRGHSDITRAYDAMYRDITGSGCATPEHLMLAVSYGLEQNWGPVGDFFGLLHSCGGSTRNLEWIKAWDIGSGNTSFSNYMLVGAFDSGTGMGVDFASGSGYVKAGEPMVHNPVMQVMFYRDGKDAPYTFALASVG